MGNMSSRDQKTEKSSSPKHEAPSEKLGESEKLEELADRVEAFIKGGACRESYAAYEDCIEKTHPDNYEPTKDTCLPMLLRCMEAHSDYYQPLIAARKAADERVDKEWDAFCQTELGRSDKWYFEGGNCKESAVAWHDCFTKDKIEDCMEEFSKLWSCMEAHSDYYHPYLALQKIGNEQLNKELEALFFKAEG